MREIAGPSFGIAAWALVTGVAMIKSGLTLPLAMFMSLAVYAGSAQLAALPLIAVNAPLVPSDSAPYQRAVVGQAKAVA